MTKKISIIGLGWLGHPLAKELVRRGYHVKGTTTTHHKIELLRQDHIDPHMLWITEEQIISDENLDQLFDTDILIINIPPGIRRNGPEYGISMKQKLLSIIPEGTFKTIYISSTAIYHAQNKTVYESDIDISRIDIQNPLQHIEFLFKSRFENNLTVLRLGGLFGGLRNPLKYYSGKNLIQNGSFPVNYLHQIDAINAIIAVIQQEKWDEIYNIVAPQHPTRKTVFEQIAKNSEYALPTFASPGNAAYKVINGEKFMRDLGFRYDCPDPANFVYDKTL